MCPKDWFRIGQIRLNVTAFEWLETTEMPHQVKVVGKWYSGPLGHDNVADVSALGGGPNIRIEYIENVRVKRAKISGSLTWTCACSKKTGGLEEKEYRIAFNQRTIDHTLYRDEDMVRVKAKMKAIDDGFSSDYAENPSMQNTDAILYPGLPVATR